MNTLAFADDKFELPGEWTASHTDEHFEQRYLEDEKLIYCETRMTVHGAGDLNSAVSSIRGPWDWWEHGKISDFEQREDGSTFQTLAPVWWFITRVGLHIFPAVDLPAEHGHRVPLLLSGDFTGPSSMDVYPGPAPATIVVRGRFHGVEYHVPAVPDAVAEALHLEAESGTMPLPFPKGTGWVGLLHLLESKAHEDPVR